MFLGQSTIQLVTLHDIGLRCNSEYSGLHVFWLKFILSVCMLMGEDAIQLGSPYVFGLEVIHDVVWLVYGPTTYFISL